MPPIDPNTLPQDVQVLHKIVLDSCEQLRHESAEKDKYRSLLRELVLLPPNAPIATDAKSIRESWAALLGPNTTVSWKVSKAEVAKSGELGYLYGIYSLSIKDPHGPPVHDTGKLVEIWKKQVDGKWKCIVDTYNSDLPVAAASEK